MLRTDRTAAALIQKLALAIATLVLSTAVPGGSEANAASRFASNSSRFAGAFVNWGPEGRERTLQAWENWLHQPPASVLGVDFYAQSTSTG
jgi:hypothetical protein